MLVGAAIPAVVFGRAVFAILLLLGFLSLLASNLRLAAWRLLLTQARQPIGALIIITLAFWVVSALGSNFPSRSLEATLRTGLFVAIAVLVYGALQTAPSLHRLCLRIFVAMSCVCTIIAILEITILPELYWGLRLKGWQKIPLQTEQKAYSALAMMMMPLLGYSAWSFNGIWRIAALFAIACLLFLVWENYNRAAIAGLLGMLIAATVAIFVGRGKRKSVLIFTVATLAVLLGVLVWLYFSRSNAVSSAPGNEWLFPVWLIDFQRQTIWAHTLEIAGQAPWFGVGANSINFIPGADAPLPGNERLHIIPAHPHNWVVEVLAETGILGFSAMLATILLAVARLLRQYRNTLSIAVFSTIAIMAGYWASGLFNFSYWSAWWQVSFFIGMAISLARIEKSAPQD